jgi:GAF domain-containing protein
MLAVNPHSAICLALTRAISRSRTVDEIYAAAFDALVSGRGVERSAILLFDPDGVMRFKASRGLSETYRLAVEGHTPWKPDTIDPEPIVISEVAREPSLAPFLAAIAEERIAAMTFIPLVSLERVIGTFHAVLPASICAQHG